jgi:hypothetical protein
MVPIYAILELGKQPKKLANLIHYEQYLTHYMKKRS